MLNLPPYSSYPLITSENIILREIIPGEINDLLPISFYEGSLASTQAEALVMIRKIKQDYLKGESIHWGIENRTSGKIIGTCGYYRGFKNEMGELGCILLPEFYGFGFMTRAMQLAIDFGFQTILLKRVKAITSVENIPAQRLLQRLDFDLVLEEEGMLYYELAAK